MLDIMRKKKQMTAFVLWGIIIALGLSMLVWGINIGGSSSSTGPGSSAAIVDDRIITVREFEYRYQQWIDYMKRNSAADLDPEMIKSLGLSQQVLNDLIGEKIVEILAEKWGLAVSPDEVRQAILNDPNLQVDGKFVGLERYKMFLASNGIPLETFESETEHVILDNKLKRLLADSLEVSDEELRQEFTKRNQSTRVAYVVLKKENFKNRVKPTEAELQAYFDSHKDSYIIKEKRRAEYLLVPTSKILPGIEVSEQEIEDEWARNPLPETVEAAHILFLVNDPSKEGQVRAKAESVLEQIRKGGDFAALAREYSEDPGSAQQGGYLGPFPRGQMVKELEDTAFSLKPGEVSGLVRVSYGFHIIKVFRHDIPTMESNRNNLMTTVRLKKAKDAARKKVEEAARLALDTRDLDAVSKEIDSGAEIKETDLFDKDDNPYSVGISQALRDDIFKIEEVGTLGSVVEHALGFAVAKLQEIQKARPGQLEEFREQVREDLIDSRSQELMLAEANKISEEAKNIGNLERAAKNLKYTPKISNDFKSDESPGEDVKDIGAFNFVAFRLGQGSVSEPIPMADTAAVLEVKSRSPFDEAAFEEGKEKLRDEMVQSLQGNYLDAYLRSFREELEEAGKIRVNPDVFEMVENLRL